MQNRILSRAAQLKTFQFVTRDAKSESENDFFSDNLEHLTALEYEARIRLTIACMKKFGTPRVCKQSDSDKKPDFNFPDPLANSLSAAELEVLLKRVSEENRLKAIKSLKKGIDINFEKLCETYYLEDFERTTILLLFANSTGKQFRDLYCLSAIDDWKHKDGGMTIGTILSIVCSDFREQIQSRKYFSNTATLIREEIAIPFQGYDCTSNVIDITVHLHERIIRYILGDHNTYDTSLQCIVREHGKVNIEQVILPDEIKTDIISTAENFKERLADKKHQRLRDFYGYGTGLVFLFHGPSGTGKTMLAHALARHLGAELLSLDVTDPSRSRFDFEYAIKHMFREARLCSGIVFLDECDDVFADNSQESCTLLVELEKAECITILATNKAVDLDPSLNRRITMKVHFDLPDAQQREKIWEALLPSHVRTGPDVDFEKLARKYLLTGGLIKNTLFMAINNAASNNGASEIILTAKDIENAAEYQSISMFENNGYGRIYTPQIDFDSIPIKIQDKRELKRLAILINELKEKGIGMNLLIGSSDLQTAIDCVDGVAKENALRVKLFNLSQLLFYKGDEMIKDYFYTAENITA